MEKDFNFVIIFKIKQWQKCASEKSIEEAPEHDFLYEKPQRE